MTRTARGAKDHGVTPAVTAQLLDDPEAARIIWDDDAVEDTAPGPA
jgi:hypothetical protein